MPLTAKQKGKNRDLVSKAAPEIVESELLGKLIPDLCLLWVIQHLPLAMGAVSW